jgi:hypothetical protein
MVQASTAGAALDADLSAARQKLRERFVQDWLACNREIERNSNSKAAWIWRAQVCPVAGAVIAATLAIVSIWTWRQRLGIKLLRFELDEVKATILAPV